MGGPGYGLPGPGGNIYNGAYGGGAYGYPYGYPYTAGAAYMNGIIPKPIILSNEYPLTI